MGIHSEHVLSKSSVFEAEMRRRLWWAMVMFDTRISETADTHTVSLDPTWDCRVPLNLNDSELRLEMKEVPGAGQRLSPSEAFFSITRAEVGDFVRFLESHLDFTSPPLKRLIDGHSDSKPYHVSIDCFERYMEDQYLRQADTGNPLHYMSIWTVRGTLAKYRLFEHHSRFADLDMLQRTTSQHDAATTHALQFLQANTYLLASPLTKKRFHWFHDVYFPFPGYMQIVQDLRRRPDSRFVRQGWNVMSENYMAWFDTTVRNETGTAIFRIFGRLILQAWEGCSKAYQQATGSEATPTIVTSIRTIMAEQSEVATMAGLANQQTSMDNDLFNFGAIRTLSTTMLPAESYDTDPGGLNFGGGSTSFSPAGQSIFNTYTNQYWCHMGAPPGWGLF
jgi:hypothetical protein